MNDKGYTRYEKGEYTIEIQSLIQSSDEEEEFVLKIFSNNIGNISLTLVDN